jgi:hypothetical protein
MNSQLRTPVVPYYRTCHQCHGRTCVLLPAGATVLDVDAEFSGQAREVADTEDGDPVGVVCHACAEALWRKS